MRTLLYLLAMIAGAAIVYRGFAEGLPAPPLSANQWGGLVAFGFGALMVLVGLRHLGQRLSGDETPLVGGKAVLLVALAAALTAGAVAWRGKARGPATECAAVLAHVQELFAAREGAEAARVRIEEARPRLMRRCLQVSPEQRRCPLRATTLEEFQRCP